jgi:hypothetical protein
VGLLSIVIDIIVSTIPLIPHLLPTLGQLRILWGLCTTCGLYWLGSLLLRSLLSLNILVHGLIRALPLKALDAT